jgi:hypothetical protein
MNEEQKKIILSISKEINDVFKKYLTDRLDVIDVVISSLIISLYVFINSIEDKEEKRKSTLLAMNLLFHYVVDKCPEINNGK